MNYQVVIVIDKNTIPEEHYFPVKLSVEDETVIIFESPKDMIMCDQPYHYVENLNDPNVIVFLTQSQSFTKTRSTFDLRNGIFLKLSFNSNCFRIIQESDSSCEEQWNMFYSEYLHFTSDQNNFYNLHFMGEIRELDLKKEEKSYAPFTPMLTININCITELTSGCKILVDNLQSKLPLIEEKAFSNINTQVSNFDCEKLGKLLFQSEKQKLHVGLFGFSKDTNYVVNKLLSSNSFLKEKQYGSGIELYKDKTNNLIFLRTFGQEDPFSKHTLQKEMDEINNIKSSTKQLLTIEEIEDDISKMAEIEQYKKRTGLRNTTVKKKLTCNFLDEMLFNLSDVCLIVLSQHDFSSGSMTWFDQQVVFNLSNKVSQNLLTNGRSKNVNLIVVYNYENVTSVEELQEIQKKNCEECFLATKKPISITLSDKNTKVINEFISFSMDEQIIIHHLFLGKDSTKAGETNEHVIEHIRNLLRSFVTCSQNNLSELTEIKTVMSRQMSKFSSNPEEIQLWYYPNDGFVFIYPQPFDLNTITSNNSSLDALIDSYMPEYDILKTESAIYVMIEAPGMEISEMKNSVEIVKRNEIKFKFIFHKGKLLLRGNKVLKGIRLINNNLITNKMNLPTYASNDNSENNVNWEGEWISRKRRFGLFKTEITIENSYNYRGKPLIHSSEGIIYLVFPKPEEYNEF